MLKMRVKKGGTRLSAGLPQDAGGMRAAGGRVGRVDKSTHLGFEVYKYWCFDSARPLGAADLSASRIPPSPLHASMLGG